VLTDTVGNLPDCGANSIKQHRRNPALMLFAILWKDIASLLSSAKGEQKIYVTKSAA